MNAVQRGSTFLISLLFLSSGLLFLRSALGGLRVDAMGSIDVLVGATFCSAGLALAYFGFSAARKTICGYGDDNSFIRDRVCVPIDGALVLRNLLPGKLAAGICARNRPPQNCGHEEEA